MPSASAKLEKQASTEAPDPLGKVLTMVEKKVRNMEKRKGRLDNYRAESQAGKELNEDQLNAIKKYEVVVDSLEFLREFQKTVATLVQEQVKLQKKQAKKEQAERQQQELQRVKEILIIQDILNNMGADDVRSHFLNGTNGAVQLTEDDLNHLDELYKLVCAEHTKDDPSLPPFEEQLSTAADHLVCILEGKNKEILGTTYKALKELIMNIHQCGYFERTPSASVEPSDDAKEYDENPATFEDYGEKEEEEYAVPQGVTEIVPSVQGQQVVVAASDIPHNQEEMHPTTAAGAPVDSYSVSGGHIPAGSTFGGPNRPITDLLSMQGGFNFLQESQVETEPPHMDPAVVATHPVAPPAMSYHTPGYPPVTQQAPPMGLASQTHQARPVAPEEQLGSVRQQQMSVGSTPQVQTQQPQQQQQMTTGGPAQDYDDPAQPIPTQTFTNQSFAAMQTTIMQVPTPAIPSNYVQATLGHGVLSNPQMAAASATVSQSPVAQMSTPTETLITNQSNLSNGGSASQSGDEQQASNNKYQIDNEENEAPGSYPHTNAGTNYNPSQGSFASNRGGRGGSRGRGPANGYSRGQRGGYGGANRGSYRGSFNSSTDGGYNSSYRRGGAPSRGASRGGSGQQTRGRGNFRSQ